jgi:hypothetical protein
MLAFLRAENGAVTVDWVVVCAAATGLAIATLELGQSGLSVYSENVRDEVQAPYFHTSWTQ